MATRYQYYDIDPYIVAAIDHRVRGLYNTHLLNGDDLDDLRQELFVHTLQYMHNFDPKRGKWTTFIDRMIKSGIANFLRARKAECRSKDNFVSLFEEDDIEMDDDSQTSLDGSYSNSCRSSESEMTDKLIDEIDLRIDIEAILATLSPLHQRICRLLMDGETLSDIARALRMPRTSIYFFKNQIQDIFFKKYFDLSPKFTVNFSFSPFK